MLLFRKTFEFAVEDMVEAGEATEKLLLDNPGGKLVEVKKKYTECKEFDYYKITVTLEFASEKKYKKGEIF